MTYKKMKTIKILKKLDSEEKARLWAWLAKFEGKEFICPECKHESYYQHHKNPEVRKCKNVILKFSFGQIPFSNIRRRPC